MVFGAFSEISEEARKLLCYAADTDPGLLKNRTVAGASRRRASTPGSRSTASGSSAATRTSPTRPGTATTTHASTTGSKLTYTLAGDSSPVTPLGARPRNPN